MVRKRRLSIACRICRTYSSTAGPLMNDLGFSDTLQILKADQDIKPSVTKEEMVMINELLHYCG